MFIVIASIPHSGTQFVWNLFPELVEARNPKKWPGKVWLHLYSERIPELKSLSDYPWIIPLRHPFAVAMSWKGRQKDLNELERMWQAVVALDRPETLYLPIQGLHRQKFLDKINTVLGTSIMTDWENKTATGLEQPLASDELQRMEPYVGWYETVCRTRYHMEGG